MSGSHKVTRSCQVFISQLPHSPPLKARLAVLEDEHHLCAFQSLHFITLKTVHSVDCKFLTFFECIPSILACYFTNFYLLFLQNIWTLLFTALITRYL